MEAPLGTCGMGVPTQVSQVIGTKAVEGYEASVKEDGVVIFELQPLERLRLERLFPGPLPRTKGHC